MKTQQIPSLRLEIIVQKQLIVLFVICAVALFVVNALVA